LRREARGRPPRAGRLSCSAEPGLSNWGISLSAGVGGVVDTCLEGSSGATDGPDRMTSRLQSSARHWTPEAPFHGACQRDLMAKDEPSRSFLHRWSSRTKAKPDVSVRGATVPQNQESPSFHTCSGSRPGHKVPCEKAGRPTLTGACSYTRWEPRAPAA